MKYMQNGGYQSNPFMRLTLLLTALLLAGFVVTNFMLYFSRMDLSPDSVVLYYLGSEEQFLPARSYLSMLEVTHGHLPMMALVILLLTHLVIFVPVSSGLKITLVVTPFISALCGEAAGWLVRFADPGFALLKVAAFLTLQASMLVLLAILGVFLLSSRHEHGSTQSRELKHARGAKRSRTIRTASHVRNPSEVERADG